jgi:hypothetical protein
MLLFDLLYWWIVSWWKDKYSLHIFFYILFSYCFIDSIYHLLKVSCSHFNSRWCSSIITLVGGAFFHGIYNFLCTLYCFSLTLTLVDGVLPQSNSGWRALLMVSFSHMHSGYCSCFWTLLQLLLMFSSLTLTLVEGYLLSHYCKIRSWVSSLFDNSLVETDLSLY